VLVSFFSSERRHEKAKRDWSSDVCSSDLGQILFTTHSPLTLGKMKKESIRILKDGTVYEPAADTFNRDITEVLEEIMEVGKRPEIGRASCRERLLDWRARCDRTEYNYTGN